MKLVIVESPNKCKKIQGYLGGGYKVVASYGHIRDLPSKEIGVKAPDYKPTYITEDARSKKNLATLKKLTREAECVFFATDPDREGEAIAWHLLDALKPKVHHRISFNEINQNAVKEAVNNPGVIDRSYVYAQEARRVLDRLVGYKVSGPLSKSVDGGLKLSAGRVQSPALRLLVERDRAIKCFTSIDHYGVRFNFEGWHADWLSKNFIEDGHSYILDKSVAEAVRSVEEFKVVSVDDSTRTKKAPPPFTTSTLIKAASAKLKINTEKVMELAQKLFEGSADSSEGYITYHRTDNPNISDEAHAKIVEWVEDNSDPDLLSPTKNTFKAKGDAQEAHEAIRPTNFEVSQLDTEDILLNTMYDLIWDRTVASQLLPAKFDTRVIKLVGVDTVNNKKVEASASFSRLAFEGWLEITRNDDAELQNEDETQIDFPSVNEGDVIQAKSSEVLSKKTKPPRKMTELELVGLLEKMGIGRPSTYASIMGVLRNRGYMIETKQRKLEHTETGALVVDQLCGRFSFIDYEFTKNIEDVLDAIAVGKKQYVDVVKMIDEKLDAELSSLPQVEQTKSNVQVTEFKCGACDKPLAKRPGKTGGHYFACTGYPDCKQTYAEHEGKPFFGKTHGCPECDGTMEQKAGKFGLYWKCGSCSINRPDDDGKPGAKKEKKATGNKPGMDCPTCGKGKLVAKKSKGKPIIGCTKFPDCRHFEWMN